jgi:hypothetical protein
MSPKLPSGSKEPKIPNPDPYRGGVDSQKQLRAFIIGLETVFLAQKARYPDHESKVALAVSLLRDTAMEWVSVHIETQSSLLSNFDSFKQALFIRFGTVDIRRDARRRLLVLSQGSRTVFQYLNTFERLAASAHWDDDTLLEPFIGGLRPELQEKISNLPSDKAESLEEIKKYLLEQERRANLNRDLDPKNRSGKLIKQSNNSSNRSHSNQYQHSPTQNYSSNAPVATTSQGGHMMDLSATSQPQTFRKISVEEKNRRRRDNLCLYCGGAGHYAQQCKERSGKVKA